MKSLCHQCQKPLASLLFCFECQHLQPCSEVPNYFEVLGIPSTYSVDGDTLEEKYQALATELHPDFYMTASETEKKQSTISSALLNKAYQQLKSPRTRASYLLDQTNQGQSLDERSLPQGFLQEMFIMQESLDELLESENRSALDELQKDLDARVAALHSQYAVLFASLEAATNSPEALQTIQTAINAERYLARLLERIQEPH